MTNLPPGALLSGAWIVAVAGTVVALPGRPLLGAAAGGLALVAGAAALVVRPAVLPLLLVAALAGVARVELLAGPVARAPAALALAGRDVLVEGTVSDDPRDLAGGYELLVQPVRATALDGSRVPAFGSLLVTAQGRRRAEYGDLVDVRGRLALPGESPGFDRRAYLAGRGAWLEMRVQSVDVVRPAGGLPRLGTAIRDTYRRAITDLLPPPHAAVLEGVVLGIRAGIPPALNQALIATGLVHLLVLSGLKVAVFARLVTALLGTVLRGAATWPAVGLIALYALAGGGSPAAVRAAAMGALALVAGRVGRPTHIWSSLAAAGAGMVGWRPELAWDVGFQLSFVGTAAIVILTPRISARLHRLPEPLREPFAVTCAAQIGTAPMMAQDFHVLSPIAPVANALVLPLLPVLVGAGLLLAPLALVPAAGALASVPVVALTSYLEQVAAWLARLPGAAIRLPALPAASGLGYYLVLAGAALAWTGRPADARRRAGIAIAVLGPLLITGGELVGWSLPRSQATALAVGDGEALLLRGPGGFVLVDGGPSPTRLHDELGLNLPPWDRTLAALLVTSNSSGHVAGLAGLNRPAEAVVTPGSPLSGTAWRHVALAEVALGARYLPVEADEAVELGGLHFEILSPEPGEPGDEVGWGGVAFRVSGSAGRPLCYFSDLAPDAQRVAAQHLKGACDTIVFGTRAAPDPDLVRASGAQELVMSCAGGARTPPGLPAGLIHRTDQEGDVTVPL